MGSELTKELLLLEELINSFVLSANAQLQYSKGDVSKKELEPFLTVLNNLSSEYIGGKDVNLSKEQVAAYALYYLPINFAKLIYIIKHSVNFDPQQTIRLLDFGCGPGTAALAVAHSFKQALEVSLYDTSSNCLAFAEKVLQHYRSDIQVNQIESIIKTPQKSFDMVIAANVLTELKNEERAGSLDQLLSLVAAEGYLLLLEPALKACTQNLMKDRTYILNSSKDFSVIFPCPTQFDCPMLQQENDDWCHGELPASFWESPPLHKQVDSLLGFNKHRVKYSAFVFQRKSPIEKNNYMRLLRPSTKTHPALLCSEQGLIKINAKSVKDHILRRALKNGNSYEKIDLCRVPSEEVLYKVARLINNNQQQNPDI